MDKKELIVTTNPYNSTKPGHLFRGYEKLRRRVIDGLYGGSSYAILGGRRCGKTSLLLQLRHDITNVGATHESTRTTLLPRYLDFQGQIPRSTSDFFSFLSQLTVNGSSANAWPGSESTQPYQDFLKHLRGISPQLREAHGSNWVTVFLIDEIETGIQFEKHSECCSNLRNFLTASDFAQNFRVVIAGVSGLSDLIKSGSPLNNLLPEPISPILGDEDARSMIRIGFTKPPFEEFENTLLELSGGHPWILQALLENMWPERSSLDVHGVQNAVRDFERNRDDIFRRWHRDFGEAGRAAYRVITVNAGHSSTHTEIRKALPPEATIGEAINVLAYHGAIKDVDASTICSTGNVFDRWFLRNFAQLADTVEVSENPKRTPVSATSGCDRERKVFVVYGRNRRVHEAVCHFLQALDLDPLEWNDIVEATGKGNPMIFEIIEKGFEMAGAAVVLFTPDDEARLLPHFHKSDDLDYETKLTPQPRQNVIFEAGLAMSRFREKTVIVRVGNVRPFTDISGMHLLDLSNDVRTREHFARRLKSCGLRVVMDDGYWRKAGTLEIAAVPQGVGNV